MAVDKNQKRKKKREEKQKARRQEVEKEVRREKAEEYDWLARRAARNGDLREALSWAFKRLKLRPADNDMRTLALRCAKALDDDDTSLTLLRQLYRDGALNTKERYLLLGRLAVSKKDYRLARPVLEDLISDADSESPQLIGRLYKTNLKEAQQLLLHCRQMEERPVGVKSQPSLPHLELRPSKASALPAIEAVPAGAAEPELGPASASVGGGGGGGAQESLPELKIVFETDPEPVLETIRSHRKSDQAALDLALRAYKLSFRTSYDQLICLPTLRDVTSLWYQEETARKVMKTFRGRAILADEVGLGKTIEAGLIVKEYLMRGLAKSALVLAPSSLVNQWREELTGKFGIPFVSTNDGLFKQDPDRFWNEPFILASIQTAKNKRHFDAVTSHAYDILVVDEAHHLKNKTTLNWKLVNSIQKTFLLMLTATPVQNSLEELYNLVTLLRPGHLKTQKAFKEEFITRGNPTDPRNREKLRQLLKEVMVRNTRSVTQLHLPPRFALTARITPTRAEEAFYQAVNGFVTSRADGRSSKISKLALKKLLEAVGSSHAATLRMLERMAESDGHGETGKQVKELIRLGREVHLSAKVRHVVELVKASKDQKIIFVNYIATLEYIQRVFREHGIRHVSYHGGLSVAQKQAAMDDFRAGAPVLLATGTGGEGHNLQFCHVMLNFDLPWNPMEIEQRIGRIHRIGQEREVQVYNFCAAGSIEDRILEILDRKINMFELVVGEIDMILGRLQGEEEFSDLVYEIWVNHPDEAERDKAFDALAARLKRARSAYAKSKELDEKLFQEDFGI
jgi:superfamily II DNA or RNA helicase